MLSDNQLAAIQDPMGISGCIYPCSTNVKKDDALSKLETAIGRAQKARNAEKSENISDAFYWWDLVFDGHFPSF